MSSELSSSIAVSVTIPTPFDGITDQKLLTSLTTLAKEHNLEYLLSYHDDGVVWGKFDANEWQLSAEKFDVSPRFRTVTLQECRVFCATAELFIWRNENTLRASLLVEGIGEKKLPYFEQTQLLWGDSVEVHKEGFALLREGAQGLRHAVPLANAQPRVCLTVRNYIDYDEYQQAYVKHSRLVSLVIGG